MTQPRRPASGRPAGGFSGCSVRATPTASPTSSPRRSTGLCLETKACCRGPVGARDANRFPTTSTLWPVFVPEKSETSIDKILVDGADAVALGRFSLVVKANGRHLSMLVAFHFTVESGYLVRLHLYEDTDLVARAVTASD